MIRFCVERYFSICSTPSSPRRGYLFHRMGMTTPTLGREGVGKTEATLHAPYQPPKKDDNDGPAWVKLVKLGRIWRNSSVCVPIEPAAIRACCVPADSPPWRDISISSMVGTTVTAIVGSDVLDAANCTVLGVTKVAVGWASTTVVVFMS